MAKSLGVSKSTAHYRVKRPEGEGMIEGYHARANGAKIGKDFLTLTLYCARYGPGYHERVGKMLAQIPGVWAVHFVLGEIDFIVLARTENRERFCKNSKRSSTQKKSKGQIR